MAFAGCDVLPAKSSAPLSNNAIRSNVIVPLTFKLVPVPSVQDAVGVTGSLLLPPQDNKLVNKPAASHLVKLFNFKISISKAMHKHSQIIAKSSEYFLAVNHV